MGFFLMPSKSRPGFHFSGLFHHLSPLHAIIPAPSFFQPGIWTIGNSNIYIVPAPYNGITMTILLRS